MMPATARRDSRHPHRRLTRAALTRGRLPLRSRAGRRLLCRRGLALCIHQRIRSPKETSRPEGVRASAWFACLGCRRGPASCLQWALRAL
eukprot:4859021-Pleurochrysis_carterae.AAC.1